MKSNLTIAFLTSTDPNDKKSWSGTYNRMFQSLKNNFVIVDAIGPIDGFLLKSIGIVNKISRFLFNKGYNHNNSIVRSYLLSLTINKRINKKKYDIIFAPASSTEVAFIKTNAKIIYLSDSSFGQLNGYYDVFSNLFKFSSKESNYIEQKAIDKSDYFIYPSKWAANYIVQNYGVDEQNVSVIPFGANINNEDIVYLEKEISNKTPITLLFLGVEWLRKGGDVVFKTFEMLLENGYDINLIVCGCVPPVSHPKMTVYAFLNKNNKEDFATFNTILSQTHFLFLPSKAECFGIAFCEASAYGIPSITTNTGGIPNAVYDGINGYCLDVNASPKEYYKTIVQLIEDKEKYKALSKSSRALYLNKLNWENWANEVAEIISKISNNNKS
ncbi:MAG: glycosyltransferase family 4 protein [Candidatus Kapaibacteriota bacterium]